MNLQDNGNKRLIALIHVINSDNPKIVDRYLFHLPFFNKSNDSPNDRSPIISKVINKNMQILITDFHF